MTNEKEAVQPQSPTRVAEHRLSLQATCRGSDTAQGTWDVTEVRSTWFLVGTMSLQQGPSAPLGSRNSTG